jgi:hypothetical protein
MKGLRAPKKFLEPGALQRFTEASSNSNHSTGPATYGASLSGMIVARFPPRQLSKTSLLKARKLMITREERNAGGSEPEGREKPRDEALSPAI